MSKKTGGPAFAAPGHPGNEFTQQEGMTLLDYFAGQTMNGIMSDPNCGLLDDDLKRYAKVSYTAAEAMLNFRNHICRSTDE